RPPRRSIPRLMVPSTNSQIESPMRAKIRPHFAMRLSVKSLLLALLRGGFLRCSGRGRLGLWFRRGLRGSRGHHALGETSRLARPLAQVVELRAPDAALSLDLEAGDL